MGAIMSNVCLDRHYRCLYEDESLGKGASSRRATSNNGYLKKSRRAMRALYNVIIQKGEQRQREGVGRRYGHGQGHKHGWRIHASLRLIYMHFILPSNLRAGSLPLSLHGETKGALSGPDRSGRNTMVVKCISWRISGFTTSQRPYPRACRTVPSYRSVWCQVTGVR